MSSDSSRIQATRPWSGRFSPIFSSVSISSTGVPASSCCRRVSMKTPWALMLSAVVS